MEGEFSEVRHNRLLEPAFCRFEEFLEVRPIHRSACPYSPECVEVEFSEVHGSKQPLRRSAKHSTTAWWHPFSVETLRLGSSGCTIVYQGVATRNDATTREILAHWTGTQLNFALTEFCEVRYPQPSPGYGKHSSFGGCTLTSLSGILLIRAEKGER